MLNPDFYPTPDTVIARMLAPYTQPFDRHNPAKKRLGDLVIMDPEAGSGAILDYITEWLSYDNHTRHRARKPIYCCELDPDLRAMLQGKRHRVVGEDFLQYQGDYFLDLIIMNPPFSAADKHILHAWEIVAPSGDVVALLNTNTLENPYTESRQLLAQVIADHGTVEHLGAVFLDAERSTDVDVSLVRLTKPAERDRLKFDFSNATQEKQPDFNTDTFKNEIATRDVIGNIIGRYEALKGQFVKLMEARAGLKHYAQGLLANEYQDVLKLATEAMEEQGLRRQYNSFADAMKQQLWRLIFDKVDLQKFMTSAVRRNFEEFSAAQGAMEFTAENVAKLVEMVLDNRESILEKAIVEVFEHFTKYHKENRVHVEGWHTNDKFKVNRKLILPNFVEMEYNGRSYRHRYHSRDVCGDIDRVMAYLTGKDFNRILSIEDAIRYERRGPIQRKIYTVQSEFFEIRCFMKGTAHLIFLDERLHQEFNLRACAGKLWLPEPEMRAYKSRRKGPFEPEPTPATKPEATMRQMPDTIGSGGQLLLGLAA